eukprot:Nk52_evm13s327 gene=Nk52_evmTU13s327
MSGSTTQDKGGDFRVLVTGGSGYVGQFVVKSLLGLCNRKGSTYTAPGEAPLADLDASRMKISYTYCKSSPGGADPGPSSYSETGIPEGYQCDLSDEDSCVSLLQSVRPHVIIHCAALSNLNQCEQDPALACRVNGCEAFLKAVEGFVTLASSTDDYNRSENGDLLFVLFSTDIVYDGKKEGITSGVVESYYQVEEGNQSQPVNQYGRSKLQAEQNIRQLGEALCGKMHWAVLRCALVFGPEADSAVTKGAYGCFLAGLVDNLLDEEEEEEEEASREQRDGVKRFKRKQIAQFEDEFRTPVYVKDIARICQALVLKQMAHCGQGQGSTTGFWEANTGKEPYQHGEIFNMGGLRRVSRYDIAVMIYQSVKELVPEIDESQGNEDSPRVVGNRVVDIMRKLPCQRPLDVSMDSRRLWDFTCVRPQAIESAIRDSVETYLLQRKVKYDKKGV